MESEEEPERIVANAPFYESGNLPAASVSKLDILMKYQGGSDLFAPVEIKLTELGSASVYAIDKADVENAVEALEVPLSKDEGSPTVFETGKLPVTTGGAPSCLDVGFRICFHFPGWHGLYEKA